jgi:TDG/mug DNA glycosylase family protein
MPEEYKELIKYRIGLTDLVKYKSGSDRTLSKNDYDVEAFRKKIEKYQPKVLGFNGKKAAKVFLNMKNIKYGRQEQTIGNTLIYVLPSTSGLASRWWNETYWEDVAKELPARYPHA